MGSGQYFPDAEIGVIDFSITADNGRRLGPFGVRAPLPLAVPHKYLGGIAHQRQKQVGLPDASPHQPTADPIQVSQGGDASVKGPEKVLVKFGEVARVVGQKVLVAMRCGEDALAGGDKGKKRLKIKQEVPLLIINNIAVSHHERSRGVEIGQDFLGYRLGFISLIGQQSLGLVIG